MKTNTFLSKALILIFAMVSLASCSDVGASEEENGKQGDVITLTTQLSSRSGVATRGTMTDNGSSITSAWEVGDKVWVNYELATDDAGNPTGVAQATVSAVDPATKAATISVDLAHPKEGNTAIRFGHPYSYWHEAIDPRTGQDGKLATINTSFGAVHGDGTLSVSGSTASLASGVTMEPDVCIWKFTFNVGGSDITDEITSLNINCGFSNNDFVVAPSSQSTIYVALLPTTGATITVTARTEAGYFSTAKSGITLTAGKLYTTAGLALTAPVAMASATSSEIGKTLAQDKYIYVNSAAAKASGSKACAVVAYVGNATGEPNYTHGLALSMRNIAGNGEVWKNTYGTKDNTAQYSFLSDALAAQESGYSLTYPRRWESNSWAAFFYGYWNNIQVDDFVERGEPSSTSGWFLPSIYQWNKIVNGLTDTEADLTLWDNAALSLYYANAKLEARGAEGFRSGAYWSSSEHSDNNAWLYWANYGKASDKTKNWNYYIRAALAF